MKKFWIYFGCLVVATALFFFGGEFLVRQVPNPYKYKHEWMKEHQGEVETLIFGNSHIYAGIRADVLGDKTFNLGGINQPLQYDYFLFTNYKCPNLKRIIVGISYPTLFTGDFEDGGDWWRAAYYKIYMDCPYHSDFSKYSSEILCCQIGVKEKIKKIILRRGTDYDEYGCITKYKLEKKNKITWDRGAVKRASYMSKHDFSAVDSNIVRLQKMADYCKAHNVQMILVTTPNYDKLVALFNPEQKAKMYELIADFQKKNPEVLYFDYLEDNRFEDDDFMDTDHLTYEKGAVKLTKILKEDIEKSCIDQFTD